jgi:hypothetical protein
VATEAADAIRTSLHDSLPEDDQAARSAHSGGARKKNDQKEDRNVGKARWNEVQRLHDGRAKDDAGAHRRHDDGADGTRRHGDRPVGGVQRPRDDRAEEEGRKEERRHG